MISISPATSSEIATVLTFVEKLLIELSDEGDEFSGLDRGKTLRDIAANADRFNPFLAKNERGEVVGVMTVVETFAIYAGGNYGVIDELYVAPEYRSNTTELPATQRSSTYCSLPAIGMTSSASP